MGASFGRRHCALCGRVLAPGEYAYRVTHARDGGSAKGSRVRLWLCERDYIKVEDGLRQSFELYDHGPAERQHVGIRTRQEVTS